MNKNTKGFTLVELLVVISIIAVLISAAMVAFSDSRMKSRDAKRTADMDAFNKAINLYINDNGDAPLPSGWVDGVSSGECLKFNAGAGLALATAGILKFIPTDPRFPNRVPAVNDCEMDSNGDPKVGACNGMCYYYFKTTTRNYKLSTYLEGDHSIHVIQNNN